MEPDGGGSLVSVRLGDTERTFTWEEFEAQVRAGRVPPDAELRIAAVTGDRFVRAHTLESYRSLRDDKALAWRARFAASPPPIATALLVGLQIRIWWMAQLPGVAGKLTAVGTKWSPYVFEDGEVWRLLSMGLLHTEFLHVSANLLWMGYVGWSIERALGWKNLVLLYFASVLGGSVLSVFWATYTPSLGASGGVFGLIGAVVVFGFVRPDVLPPEARRWFGPAMLPYLVLMFWSGWSSPSTDNAAHLGGLLTGLGLGLVIDPDEVERRRGWARGVRWATALLGVVLLVGLGVVGPRVEPLVDMERARIASLPPTDPRRQVPKPVRPEREPERPPLTWSVPGGWRTASDDARFPGFAGPKDGGRARFFGVRLADRGATADPAEAGQAWVDQLRRSWPEAEVAEPQPATLGGVTGLAIQARFGHPGDERVATWRGASRGVWLLESVWQVDADRAARLAPLAARLDGAIRWDEPAELVSARAEAKATPRSVRVRDRLARALARTGDVDGAIAVREALVTERPEDADVWTAYLGDLAVLGRAVAGRPVVDDVSRRALAAVPSPPVVVAVADLLGAVGRADEARGLLIVAWDRAPGETAIKRARTRHGLPVALVAGTGLPWPLVYGVDGAPRDAAEVAARQARPLTLEAASEAADAAAADRRSATELAASAVARGATEDVVPLLVLRDGWATDDAGAVRVVAEDLRRAADGDAPDWVPDELTAALADHPGFLPALEATLPAQ